MSEAEATIENTVEILGAITRRDGGTRLIGRHADGRYVLGDLEEGIGFDGKPTQKFATLMPGVTFADLARLAEDVIAGRDRTTGRDVLMLALGYAALGAEFQFPSAAILSAATSPAAPASSSSHAAGGEPSPQA